MYTFKRVSYYTELSSVKLKNTSMLFMVTWLIIANHKIPFWAFNVNFRDEQTNKWVNKYIINNKMVKNKLLTNKTIIQCGPWNKIKI